MKIFTFIRNLLLTMMVLGLLGLAAMVAVIIAIF